MNRTTWLSLSLALCLAAGGLPEAAAARAAPAAGASTPDYAALDAREAADAAIVQNAFKIFQRQGYSAMPGLAPDLKAVLERAPASYPQLEMREHLAIVRGDDPDLVLPLTLMATTRFAQDGGSGSVITRFNTYPMAALMLGLWANETGDGKAAIKVLKKGLELQPGNPLLSAELGAAYTLLHKWKDALAVYQAALEANPLMGKLDLARLLRGKGFALIELGRLDEAEEAYTQSLAAQPGHGGALHELGYIRDLRRGKPAAPTGILSGKEAQERDPS